MSETDDAMARVGARVRYERQLGHSYTDSAIRLDDIEAILARLAVTEDAARRMDALRPFLSVGGSGGDETWGLWCVAESQHAEEDAVAALYWRGAADDAEEQKRENGEAEWGPSVDGMLDEMIAIDAARTAERADRSTASTSAHLRLK